MQNTRAYTDQELLEALCEVYNRVPVRDLSRSAYKEYASPHHPHPQTIERWLGPWCDVREVVHMSGDVLRRYEIMFCGAIND